MQPIAQWSRILRQNRNNVAILLFVNLNVSKSIHGESPFSRPRIRSSAAASKMLHLVRISAQDDAKLIPGGKDRCLSIILKIKFLSNLGVSDEEWLSSCGFVNPLQ